ncbi:MAG TPA: hypothetical protein DFH32_07320 [Lachnospiraceae bacterium]|nr:hypothetical protein [Lachnospiraceae bacterium]HCX41548.1 hypothetical protein [Lachnospiraceae bacterium]
MPAIFRQILPVLLSLSPTLYLIFHHFCSILSLQGVEASEYYERRTISMQLNPNCVRDVLIAVEANTGYNIYFDYPKERDNAPSLSTYSDDEIRYHILQCAKANLIELKSRDLAGNLGITDLTPNGHEFLANIRSDTVWNNVKEVSSKIGSTSISALAQIASGTITALIKYQLGI